MTFRPGWRPDPPKAAGEKPDWDARAKLRAEPIPSSVAGRHLAPTRFNQGGQGSCVGQAIAGAIRASHIQQGVAVPEPPAPRWFYWLGRAATNETNDDNGTFIRLGLAGGVKLGYPRNSDWPYIDDGKSFREPPPMHIATAAYDQRQPTSYHRIFETGDARILAVKRALAQGYPVVFGTLVSDRFCANDLGRGPVLPPIGEPIAGGHAMFICGYDPVSFDVVNSWGEDWGDQGFWSMDPRYLAWEETRDIWIIESAPPFSGGAS